MFVARDTHLQDACEQGINVTEIFTAQQIGHKSSTSTDSCQKGTTFVATYSSMKTSEQIKDQIQISTKKRWCAGLCALRSTGAQKGWKLS